jgi:hypothetical protein
MKTTLGKTAYESEFQDYHATHSWNFVWLFAAARIATYRVGEKS